MKNAIKINACFNLIVLFLLLMTGGTLSAKENEANQKKPSTEQLLALLIRHQAVPLDTVSDEKGCNFNDKSQVTLGEYLAFLTATLDPTWGKSGLTSSCEPLEKHDILQCNVMFRTGLGTEDPWSYGVRFNLIKGQLDTKSLSCPGGS